MPRATRSVRCPFARLWAWSLIVVGLVSGLMISPDMTHQRSQPMLVLRPTVMRSNHPPSPPPRTTRRTRRTPRPTRTPSPSPPTIGSVAAPSMDWLCLAQVIWFESAHEPLEGIEAVAAVVFNRIAAPQYPNSICGVVYQKQQFSWTVDTSRWSVVPPRKYIQLANTFLSNRAILALTYRNFTHFHHISITPNWSQQLTYKVTYGQHKFYAQ